MQAPDEPGWTPRHPFAWAAAACAIATLALAFPALGGGFLVNPMSDQYLGGYPVREFAAQVFRATHDFPQWSPYLYGGMPYVAAMHGDIFYPTFLLRLVLGTDVGMTWSFVVHVFLAGFLTFGFLRACRLSFSASLVGGLAYMMGGNIAGLVGPGHDGKLYVSALLAATLWLLVLGVREGRPWVWGLLCLVVGLAVLSPHPQALQYMLLWAGGFALYLGFGTWSGERLPRNVALKRLAFGLGAVVVGAAIGAIQYLPVAEYVSWSPRSTGVGGYEVATSFSFPPEELLNAYLPQFSGILFSYWGRNGFHFHSDYIGATVLLLAGAAFAARPRVGRGFVWFWIGALILSLLWAMGGFTPFFRLVYLLVPGTRFFRAPSTILFVVAFCFSVLAALGSERLFSRSVRERYLLGWVIAAAAVALLAPAGFFTGLANLISPNQADRIRANASAVTLGALRSFGFIALTAAVLFAGLRQKLRPPLVLAGVAVLLVADLWSVVRQYWVFSPPGPALYASDATIDYVRKQPQPGRVLPLLTSGENVAYHDPYLQGDGLMVHGIRNARGYHGNHIARYGELGADNDQLVLSGRFWQLANIKYLLTNDGKLAEQGLKLAVGPVKNVAGSTVYLYELPGENPLAWVTAAIVKAGDEATFKTLYHPQFDLRTAALFDTSAAVTARTDLKAVPVAPTVKVSVRSFEAGHIRLDFDQPVPAGSAVVVSENYYPGWQATVGGKPVPIGRADLSLIGVELPEGAREVELSFSNASYRRGKAITLAALILSVVLAGVGAVGGRRGRNE